MTGNSKLELVCKPMIFLLEKDVGGVRVKCIA